MSEFQRVLTLPGDALGPLLVASTDEGFGFVERLLREWQDGTMRFDRSGELLLAAYDEATILAIGGLTGDPYTGEAALGRLRHIYVRPDARRRGIGRRLVRASNAPHRPPTARWYCGPTHQPRRDFTSRLGTHHYQPAGQPRTGAS